MEKKKSAKNMKRRRSTKKTKGSPFARTVKRLFRRNKKFVIAGVAALLLLLIIIFGAKSCGVKHNTPEGVVKSLIESYFDGKQGNIRDCYGVKELDENLKKEVDSTIRYFNIHNAKELSIDDCGIISKNNNYTYVYVVYSVELENGQRYPGISTYMVEMKEEEYYVLPSSKISSDMSKQAAEEYAEFMITDPYKRYVTAYDTFIKKNPGYEDRIAEKLR